MKTRPRLLFVHTGGTLSMVGSDRTGPLHPSHYAEAMLPYVAGLDEIAEIAGTVVSSIDSSDMTPELWDRIAATIAEHMDDYDGFVVLHGTDTMAYTASALSFALPNLPKPVVLTGSQRPLAVARTDARANLVHAALCATMPIREVTVCFGSRLFRGNRTSKVSIQDYAAFESPNHPPLVELGVDIEHRAPPWPWTAPFRHEPGFDTDVVQLVVFPGLSADIVDRCVDAGSRAIVLRGFGEGNLPRSGWPDAVLRATKQGVVVVIGSQCHNGRVLPGRYEGSARARDAGAAFSGDQTPEATLVKTMWLLHRDVRGEEFHRRLLEPMAGECSDPQTDPSTGDGTA